VQLLARWVRLLFLIGQDMGIANSTLSETPVTGAQRRVQRVGVPTFLESRIQVRAILFGEMSIGRTVCVRNQKANNNRVVKLRFHRDLASGRSDVAWVPFYREGTHSFYILRCVWCFTQSVKYL